MTSPIATNADMTPETFRIHVADEDVDDLRRRLAATRLPPDLGDDWRYGTSRTYLEGLLEAWGTRYDWREHEAAMNAHDHRRVTVSGQVLHYLHVPRAGALPLLLVSGWPGSFWDFADALPLLDGNELVVPDLPGQGFSTPLSTTGIGFAETAEMYHRLMTEVLGHRRYGIYGTDWGALIGQQLAHAHPEAVVGLHTTMPCPFDFPLKDATLWAPEEQSRREASDRWAAESGYFQLQLQRPQTVGYLTDSPAATAAWIVDRVHSWTDHGGDLEQAYPRERLLTMLSIYWFTNTLGTAARYYAESFGRPWGPVRPGAPVVGVPTAVAAYPKENGAYPRRQLEGYFDLQRYTVMDRGAHFPAIESPESLCQDITAFFAGLPAE